MEFIYKYNAGLSSVLNVFLASMIRVHCEPEVWLPDARFAHFSAANLPEGCGPPWWLSITGYFGCICHMPIS